MPCSFPRVVLLPSGCARRGRRSPCTSFQSTSTGFEALLPLPSFFGRRLLCLLPSKSALHRLPYLRLYSLFLGWSWLSGLAPVEVECPAADRPKTASSVDISDRSWPTGFTPVEVMNPAAARSETIPLVAGGALESSWAAVSVTLARATRSATAVAAASMPLVGTSRDSEELARSCFFDAGDVVSAFEALRCPMVFPWIGCSISMILLFVPFLDDMLILLL